MNTKEMYLAGWSVTINNDIAYLSGTWERIDDVKLEKITALRFEDAEAGYEPGSGSVEATVPGFVITTDYGVYWCSSYEVDKYTLADTMNSLLRVMPEDTVRLLADGNLLRNRMNAAITKYVQEHGIIYSPETEDN